MIEADDSWTLYSYRLENAMKEAGIGTADLARAMGISYQAVRKVVLGGQFGTENNAAAAKLLGVSSDWLATGKGEPRPAGTLAAREVDSLLDKYGQVLRDLEAIPLPWREPILDTIRQEAARARASAEHLRTLSATPAPAAVDPVTPGKPQDPDATAARLLAEGQRLDEIARRRR